MVVDRRPRVNMAVDREGVRLSVPRLRPALRKGAGQPVELARAVRCQLEAQQPDAAHSTDLHRRFHDLGCPHLVLRPSGGVVDPDARFARAPGKQGNGDDDSRHDERADTRE